MNRESPILEVRSRKKLFVRLREYSISPNMDVKVQELRSLGNGALNSSHVYKLMIVVRVAMMA